MSGKSITVKRWRSFLGLAEDQLELRLARLDQLAADPNQQGRFDQVLLLDVIEHIMDAPAAMRHIHALTSEDGLVYITTPDRDWEGNADRIRVTRTEDGWHVRNGYTIEQLESILDQAGFEPVDRLRFGTKGSTLVTWIQHHVFRSWIDPLTVLLFPLLKLLGIALSPWRDPHTIFVLRASAARRRVQSGFDQGRLNVNACDRIGIVAILLWPQIPFRGGPVRPDSLWRSLATTCSSPVRMRDLRLIRPSSASPGLAGWDDSSRHFMIGAAAGSAS